jgi:hypothetical protein
VDFQAANTRLAALETDEALARADNFRRRYSALKFVAQVSDYAAWRPASEGWPSLLPRAEALKQRMHEANERQFATVRGQIRAGARTPADLRQMLNARTDYTPKEGGAMLSGPDPLDVFLDGLLGFGAPASRREGLPPDQSPYEPMPARGVLDLADRLGWDEGDVFYDIGSGLGRVVILFHLVTGRPARGVEIDPALCEPALQSARRLGLTAVQFFRADAREADYHEGTIFFMFTPFRASMWRAVLDRLRQQSRQRRMRLCTLGPCTFDTVQEAWLQSLDAAPPHTYKVALFESR